MPPPFWAELPAMVGGTDRRRWRRRHCRYAPPLLVALFSSMVEPVTVRFSRVEHAPPLRRCRW